MLHVGIPRKWLVGVLASALLAMAVATAATMAIPSVHAQVPATPTSVACAAEQTDTSADAETADSQDSDNVDVQCGDQTATDGPEADAQDGADTDRLQQGDQTSSDTGLNGG